MEENFVDEYINKCLDEGITKPVDICEKAVKEVTEIDLKIQEIQLLRERRDSLVQVLRTFNHESVKTKGRRHKSPQVDESIASTEEDPEFKLLMEGICNLLEGSDSTMSTRNIISKVDKEDKPNDVYVVLKRLFEVGILGRDDNRQILRGPNWENRGDYLTNN